jgi:hypothetical protein
MGFHEFYSVGMVRINLRFEKRHLKRREIHNKLRSRSNVECLSSNPKPKYQTLGFEFRHSFVICLPV